MQKRRFLQLALALAAPLAITACGEKSAETKAPAKSAPEAEKTPAGAAKGPLKVAFVYINPVSEEGWTSRHDLARRELEAHYGDRIEVKTIENVPGTADAERVLRDLCHQGYQLIFATSFSYMNGAHKVAKEFPNVVFEHCTGYKTAPNIGVYAGRFYESRYLAGKLAAASTKTNVLGYVAAFPIPEVLQGINAYMLGARSVNPKAELRIVWTASWYDPGKESDAVQSLVGLGADVITHHTDSSAVALACEKLKTKVIAYNTSMPKAAPTMQIGAAVPVWTDFYIERVAEVMEGRWTARNAWGGFKDGMVDLIDVTKAIPESVAKDINASRETLRKGELNIFAGPIRTNDGKEAVPAGQALTDEQLFSMNFLVEGIVGKLPTTN